MASAIPKQNDFMMNRGREEEEKAGTSESFNNSVHSELYKQRPDERGTSTSRPDYTGAGSRKRIQQLRLDQMQAANSETLDSINSGVSKLYDASERSRTEMLKNTGATVAKGAAKNAATMAGYAMDPSIGFGISTALDTLGNIFRKENQSQLIVLADIRDGVINVDKITGERVVPGIDRQTELAEDEDERIKSYQTGAKAKDIKGAEETPYEKANLKKLLGGVGLGALGIGGAAATGGLAPLLALIPALGDTLGMAGVFKKKGEKILPEKIADMFSQYNPFTGKSSAEQALERGDAKRSKIVALEEKAANKYAPGNLPLMRILMRPARLIIAGLNTFEEKMLALTIASVNLDRESVKRLIYLSRGLVGRDEEMHKIAPKNTAMSMLHEAIQGMPGGLSQVFNTATGLAKLPFKALGLVGSLFTRDNPIAKLVTFFKDSKKRKKGKEVDNDEILKEAGLKMKLQDRAATFVADVLPQIAIDLNRGMWKAVGLLSQLVQSSTGIEVTTEERSEIEAQQQEKVFNAIDGRAMNMEEEAEFRVKAEERFREAAAKKKVGSTLFSNTKEAIQFWKEKDADTSARNQETLNDSVSQALTSTYKQQSVQFKELEEKRFEENEKSRLKRESKVQGWVAKATTGTAIAAGITASFMSGGLLSPLAIAMLATAGGGGAIGLNAARSKKFKSEQESRDEFEANETKIEIGSMGERLEKKIALLRPVNTQEDAESIARQQINDQAKTSTGITGVSVSGILEDMDVTILDINANIIDFKNDNNTKLQELIDIFTTEEIEIQNEKGTRPLPISIASDASNDEYEQPVKIAAAKGLKKHKLEPGQIIEVGDQESGKPTGYEEAIEVDKQGRVTVTPIGKLVKSAKSFFKDKGQILKDLVNKGDDSKTLGVETGAWTFGSLLGKLAQGTMKKVGGSPLAELSANATAGNFGAVITTNLLNRLLDKKEDREPVGDLVANTLIEGSAWTAGGIGAGLLDGIISASSGAFLAGGVPVIATTILQQLYKGIKEGEFKDFKDPEKREDIVSKTLGNAVGWTAGGAGASAIATALIGTAASGPIMAALIPSLGAVGLSLLATHGFKKLAKMGLSKEEIEPIIDNKEALQKANSISPVNDEVNIAKTIRDMIPANDENVIPARLAAYDGVKKLKLEPGQKLRVGDKKDGTTGYEEDIEQDEQGRITVTPIGKLAIDKSKLAENRKKEKNKPFNIRRDDDMEKLSLDSGDSLKYLNKELTKKPDFGKLLFGELTDWHKGNYEEDTPVESEILNNLKKWFWGYFTQGFNSKLIPVFADTFEKLIPYKDQYPNELLTPEGERFRGINTHEHGKFDFEKTNLLKQTDQVEIPYLYDAATPAAQSWTMQEKLAKIYTQEKNYDKVNSGIGFVMKNEDGSSNEFMNYNFSNFLHGLMGDWFKMDETIRISKEPLETTTMPMDIDSPLFKALVGTTDTDYPALAERLYKDKEDRKGFLEKMLPNLYEDGDLKNVFSMIKDKFKKEEVPQHEKYWREFKTGGDSNKGEMFVAGDSGDPNKENKELVVNSGGGPIVPFSLFESMDSNLVDIKSILNKQGRPSRTRLSRSERKERVDELEMQKKTSAAIVGLDGKTMSPKNNFLKDKIKQDAVNDEEDKKEKIVNNRWDKQNELLQELIDKSGGSKDKKKEKKGLLGMLDGLFSKFFGPGGMLLTGIGLLFSPIKTLLTKMGSSIFSGFKNVGKSIWDGTKKYADKAWQGVKNAGSKWLDVEKAKFTEVKDRIMNSDTVKSISKNASAFKDKASGMWSSFKDKFKKDPNKPGLFQRAKGMVKGIGKTIATSSVGEAVGSLKDDAVSGIKSVGTKLGKIKSEISEKGFKKYAIEKATQAKKLATQGISKVGKFIADKGGNKLLDNVGKLLLSGKSVGSGLLSKVGGFLGKSGGWLVQLALAIPEFFEIINDKKMKPMEKKRRLMKLAGSTIGGVAVGAGLGLLMGGGITPLSLFTAVAGGFAGGMAGEAIAEKISDFMGWKEIEEMETPTVGKEKKITPDSVKSKEKLIDPSNPIVPKETFGTLRNAIAVTTPIIPKVEIEDSKQSVIPNEVISEVPKIEDPKSTFKTPKQPVIDTVPITPTISTVPIASKHIDKNTIDTAIGQTSKKIADLKKEKDDKWDINVIGKYQTQNKIDDETEKLQGMQGISKLEKQKKDTRWYNSTSGIDDQLTDKKSTVYDNFDKTKISKEAQLKVDEISTLEKEKEGKAFYEFWDKGSLDEQIKKKKAELVDSGLLAATNEVKGLTGELETTGDTAQTTTGVLEGLITTLEGLGTTIRGKFSEKNIDDVKKSIIGTKDKFVGKSQEFVEAGEKTIEEANKDPRVKALKTRVGEIKDTSTSKFKTLATDTSDNIEKAETYIGDKTIQAQEFVAPFAKQVTQRFNEVTNQAQEFVAPFAKQATQKFNEVTSKIPTLEQIGDETKPIVEKKAEEAGNFFSQLYKKYTGEHAKGTGDSVLKPGEVGVSGEAGAEFIISTKKGTKIVPFNKIDKPIKNLSPRNVISTAADLITDGKKELIKKVASFTDKIKNGKDMKNAIEAAKSMKKKYLDTFFQAISKTETSSFNAPEIKNRIVDMKKQEDVKTRINKYKNAKVNKTNPTSYEHSKITKEDITSNESKLSEKPQEQHLQQQQPVSTVVPIQIPQQQASNGAEPKENGPAHPTDAFFEKIINDLFTITPMKMYSNIEDLIGYSKTPFS